MPAITSYGTWYPEGYPGRAFNLTEAFSVVYPTSDATKVEVRFRSSSITSVEFDRDDFEDAMNAL